MGRCGGNKERVQGQSNIQYVNIRSTMMVSPLVGSFIGKGSWVKALESREAGETVLLSRSSLYVFFRENNMFLF